ncbi:MAG: hypothetical protein GXY83_03630 [Rhodopirellula sp.]|nr:hypothetical protein [Rhodopirellula sp.]
MVQQEHQSYDRSSKWLIQHHGDSMLRLADIENIEAWRPAQAEVVQPRQLPDGLLEARLEGEARDDLFLLEVATYPERRLGAQLTRDLMLVYLDRGELPEAVTLVLRPKGRFRVPTQQNLRSRRGLSACRVKWRVVELWNVPAKKLLQSQDVGLIPWIPLTDFADSPETVIRNCREAIEQHAPPGEKANLLAVTQVLTRLRYNDSGLLSVLLGILGGRKTMIESPLIQELVDERFRSMLENKDTMGEWPLIQELVDERLQEAVRANAQENILAFLGARFGEVPLGLAEMIRMVIDREHLANLVRKAASCADLEAFRRELQR